MRFYCYVHQLTYQKTQDLVIILKIEAVSS